MHILEIVSFLPPYGGYFAIEQASAVQRAGHKVGMLYVQQLGLKVDGLKAWTTGHVPGMMQFDARGLEIHHDIFRGIPKNVRYNRRRYCRLTARMFEAYVARHGRPDLLHAHCAKWSGIAAMEISLTTGIPYFVSEHFSSGCYEMDFGMGWTKDRWAIPLIRQCYSKAACVIPVAEELVEDNARFFGRDYRHSTVSNITDTEFFGFRQRTSRDGRPFRFCCLANANGGFFTLKGYDLLAAAFSGMKDCELHIAGRATDSAEFRERFAAAGGGCLDTGRIVFHGTLDREGVRSLLYHCDALVLASRSEVQPLVVMEALSTGIPVVGTDAVPACERLEGAVLIAESGDSSSLSQCMEQIKKVQPSQSFSNSVAAISSPESVAAQLLGLFSSSL